MNLNQKWCHLPMPQHSGGRSQKDQGQDHFQLQRDIPCLKQNKNRKGTLQEQNLPMKHLCPGYFTKFLMLLECWAALGNSSALKVELSGSLSAGSTKTNHFSSGSLKDYLNCSGGDSPAPGWSLLKSLRRIYLLSNLWDGWPPRVAHPLGRERSPLSSLPQTHFRKVTAYDSTSAHLSTWQWATHSYFFIREELSIKHSHPRLHY